VRAVLLFFYGAGPVCAVPLFILNHCIDGTRLIRILSHCYCGNGPSVLPLTGQGLLNNISSILLHSYRDNVPLILYVYLFIWCAKIDGTRL
jgi:hypothetical protein